MTNTPPKLIPGPKPMPILGYIPHFLRYGGFLPTLIADLKQYGDIVQYGNSIFVVAHPDYAEDVFVTRHADFSRARTAEGKPVVPGYVLRNSLLTIVDNDKWLMHRRIIQPTFHRKRIDAAGNEIVAAAQALIDHWRGLPDGTVIDLQQEMQRYAMDVLNRVVFSADTKAQGIEISSTVIQAVDQLVEARTGFFRFIRARQKQQRLDATIARMDQLISDYVEQRRRTDASDDDLLAALLEACDEETGEHLSDSQIRDELAGFFAAGYETTAVTLTWILYLLSENREARARLQAELSTVFAAGENPTLDTFAQLRFARAVIEETMRHYPTVPTIPRSALRETSVGDHVLPVDAYTFVSVYHIHHHPDLWSDPHIFRPERFLSTEGRPQHRFAYMPFGAGGHLCIGSHLAMLEMQVMLALASREFTFDVKEGHRVKKQFGIVLEPKNGMPMRIRKRG